MSGKSQVFFIKFYSFSSTSINSPVFFFKKPFTVIHTLPPAALISPCSDLVHDYFCQTPCTLLPTSCATLQTLHRSSLHTLSLSVPLVGSFGRSPYAFTVLITLPVFSTLDITLPPYLQLYYQLTLRQGNSLPLEHQP